MSRGIVSSTEATERLRICFCSKLVQPYSSLSLSFFFFFSRHLLDTLLDSSDLDCIWPAHSKAKTFPDRNTLTLITCFSLTCDWLLLINAADSLFLFTSPIGV